MFNTWLEYFILELLSQVVLYLDSFNADMYLQLLEFDESKAALAGAASQDDPNTGKKDE